MCGGRTNKVGPWHAELYEDSLCKVEMEISIEPNGPSLVDSVLNAVEKVQETFMDKPNTSVVRAQLKAALIDAIQDCYGFETNVKIKRKEYSINDDGELDSRWVTTPGMTTTNLETLFNKIQGLNKNTEKLNKNTKKFNLYTVIYGVITIAAIIIIGVLSK